MVEVTKAPSRGNLFEKISKFEAEYAIRIHDQLVRLAVIMPDGDWKIAIRP